jgi:chromosomal replication initiator protein
MQISHPKVKKIIAQSERRIKKLTGNESVLLLVMKQPNNKMTFDQIEAIICSIRKQDPNKVYRKTRKREIVITRHLIAYYAKICTGMTLKQIGTRMGGKDHTTVIHSIEKVNELADTNDILIHDDMLAIHYEIEKLAEA